MPVDRPTFEETMRGRAGPPEIERCDVTDLATHRAALEELFAARSGDLVSILQGLQRMFGFLPANVLALMAARCGWPLARVYGVATFYSGFVFAPRGRHLVRICHGTACHVRGAQRLTEHLEEHLEVRSGGTTADRAFSLEPVACIGCCSLAPAMQVDERVHGRLDAGRAAGVIEGIRAADVAGQADRVGVDAPEPPAPAGGPR